MRRTAITTAVSSADDEGVLIVGLNVKPKRDEVADLAARVEAETAKTVAERNGAPMDVLLRLVASLRDPEDTSQNALWKRAVTIEHIERQPVRVFDTAGTRTSWTGEIRLTGAARVFSIPFSGELLDGACAGLARKTDEVMEALRNGIPFDAQNVSNPQGVRLALAHRLGYDSRRFGLLSCPDPRLVTIAAWIASDRARPLDLVAADLGEPLTLVAQVAQQLRSGRATWHLLNTHT